MRHKAFGAPVLDDGTHSVPSVEFLDVILKIDEEYGYTLPGHGSVTWPEADQYHGACGSFHGTYASVGGYLRSVKWSCSKSTCPRCFGSWAAHRAKKSAAYLYAVSEKLDVNIYHVALSLRPGSWEGEKDAIARVRKFLEGLHDSVSNGELGFALTFHPYNIRCELGHSIEDRSHFLPGRCPKCLLVFGDSMPLTTWRMSWFPHYHLITNFFVNPANFGRLREAERKYGLKFTNFSQNARMRDRSKPGCIELKDDLEGLLAYELGHAGVLREHPNSQKIRYYGSFSHTKWVAKYEEIVELSRDAKSHPFYKVKVDGGHVKVRDTGYVYSHRKVPNACCCDFNDDGDRIGRRCLYCRIASWESKMSWQDRRDVDWTKFPLLVIKVVCIVQRRNEPPPVPVDPVWNPVIVPDATLPVVRRSTCAWMNF